MSDYDSPEPVTKKPNFIKGPLTFKGSLQPTLNTVSPSNNNSKLTLHDSIEAGQPLSGKKQAVIVKKVQKRLQLKNIIILKFRNKYACTIDIEDELNKFIQIKLDELFARELFDERDLVDVDKEISAKYEEIKLKNKTFVKSTRDSDRSIPIKLRKLDNLADLASHR